MVPGPVGGWIPVCAWVDTEREILLKENFGSQESLTFYASKSKQNCVVKLEIFNLSESRKFFRTEASWNLYSLKVRFELNVS